MADKRKRRVVIRIKRKKYAKRKAAQGLKKVVGHENGRRKIRFVKPAE